MNLQLRTMTSFTLTQIIVISMHMVQCLMHRPVDMLPRPKKMKWLNAMEQLEENNVITFSKNLEGTGFFALLGRLLKTIQE